MLIYAGKDVCPGGIPVLSISAESPWYSQQRP